MKSTVFSLFIILTLNSCDYQERKIYKSIDLDTYKKYEVIDTIYNKPDYIATECKNTIPYFTTSVTLIRKVNKNKYSYFLLKSDAYIENDSTVVAYAMPFKSTSDEGAFQKNGIWLFAEFYTEKTDSTGIFQTSESGVKYSIDSLPPDLKEANRPTSEGIYYFENGHLIKLSSEQSEDKFYSFQRNGFYFIPNKGRLFKRHTIQSVK